MSSPVKEAAIGTVDGVNTDFDTGAAYEPGSVVAFLNGQARPGHQTELGGTAFRLEFAPETGDTVAVYYVPL